MAVYGEFRVAAVNGAAWLARTSGATGSHCRQALDTARRLEGCPDTKKALLAGELSLAQASGYMTTQRNPSPCRSCRRRILGVRPVQSRYRGSR